MAKWLPIDTAPQDGKTKIICGAWPKDNPSGGIVAILALEPIGSQQGDHDVWGKPRAVFGMGCLFFPTHWMPIEPSPHLRDDDGAR